MLSPCRINSITISTPCGRVSPSKDDPNATCAFWHEEEAKWSAEGVETLSSEAGASKWERSGELLIVVTGYISIFDKLHFPLFSI